MTTTDIADAVFDHADTNQDGRIDRNEMRNFLSGRTGVTTSYESVGGRYDVGDGFAGRFDQYNAYDVASGGRYHNSERVIHTSGKSETEHYLATAAHDIYRDSNPRIIRRTDTASPVTYEQRVSVRYLRPPTPPPPEPLIIKEVRPPQAPAPPPLVIQERPPSLPSLPPLVLRERPPTPPPRIPGEIKIRELSPIPAPPRSVVIERFSAAPPKPRDIIIERWLPYGPRPERRTIVEPAPPAPRYQEPSNTIILHEGGDARVIRKFENLGVSREDPHTYVSRYGGSLLDSKTLVHEAHIAGVIEDISTTSVSTSINTYVGGYGDYNRSSGTIHRVYTPSSGVRETIHTHYGSGSHLADGLSNEGSSYHVTYRSPSS